MVSLALGFRSSGASSDGDRKLAELKRAETAGFHFWHNGERWFTRMGYAQFGRTDGYPYLFAALADVVEWLDRQDELRRKGMEIRDQSAIWDRMN